MKLQSEALLRRGGDDLADGELLGLLLGPGVKSTVAEGLLDEFGGLRGVLDARPAALLAWPGLGTCRVARLKTLLPLAERYERARLEHGGLIADARSAERFLTRRLAGRPREIFAAMFLNARHRLLGFEELFAGSVDRAQVYPREVLRRALLNNAAALVLAHNHPSGNPEPSAADIALTERLVKLLCEVDVRVLDHFVVGQGRAVSLAERGLI
ncbi:MAG: DNA repair protein RadC [Pseudomonadota bacterium]